MFCERTRVIALLLSILSLSACAFKSPVHSKMHGVYDFTYPTPYLIATFGNDGSDYLDEFPYSLIHRNIGREFAPFEKPKFEEITGPISVRVEFYYYRYAIDSGSEEYLVRDLATGRGIRINAELGKYLVKRNP